MKDNRVLSEDYSKLSVINKETGEEIAVVTHELITTADEKIIVKLTPKYEVIKTWRKIWYAIKCKGTINSNILLKYRKEMF